jgi:HK97 family phage portal protein
MGDVYYELAADNLSGLLGKITVPATEIIHDRWNTFWHPLVGVSPIYAAGLSATQGRKIQNNSATFFENMSRPGGMLTAPGDIPDETAARLKGEFESNFSGRNLGRLFVGGSGLSFNGTAIPADQAQLIEQLNWTVADIARAFHVPLFKVGAETGRNAGTMSVEAQQQLYMNDCLQILIEGIEACLCDGLALPSGYEVELDEDGLLRMDKAAQADALVKYVGGGVMTPNEARAKLDLPPLTGGNTVYLQQQQYSIEALDERDQNKPFAKPVAAAPAVPAIPADPAQDPAKQAAVETSALMAALTKGLEHV